MGCAAKGVTARAYSAGGPPALQPVTSFAPSIVFDFGCLWQPVMGHAPPAHLAPRLRSRSPRGWWRRCSRRGRAEASLLTGFVHRCHPSIPRPPSRLQSPAVPRSAPPRRAINPRSRPPRRGSLPASGSRLTTASRRQARPSGKRYFPFARDPADSASRRLSGLGLFHGWLRVLRTLRSSAKT
jgi:hypothetical protein